MTIIFRFMNLFPIKNTTINSDSLDKHRTFKKKIRMNKFKLAIGLHNHQPVGNFDFVFDESHQKAYKPFFELLANYPDIRISLHQSGILWDWQTNHKPEYIKLIQSLINKNQIELMTGGFYEPILVSISETDCYGQIEKLNAYINKTFGVHTQGAWLTERIWEPHLPKILHNAGIKFIPVDDTHFIYAGFDESQLTGPFVTEFEGKELTLLPISKKMRYLIPFGTVDEVISELKTMAEQNPNGMVIYADDGEKFGSWPKTFKHCYEDKWLETFFGAILANSDWLEIVPLSEASSVAPVGRAYLPSASYAEMLHWSLPAKPFIEYENFEHFLKDSHKLNDYGRFVRGGHWRGFLTKYEEVNFMHKKMLYLSDKLENLKSKHQKSELFIQAQDNLFASQCNCPYWHGVFGGLYLPHIRQAIYQHLITAESLIRQMEKEPLQISTFDIDYDGHDEILVESKKLTAMFKPQIGGSLIEFSSIDKKFSLTDTLTRRKEGYHLKLEQAVTEENAGESKSIHDLVLTKEEGLNKLLVEDWYLKRCFIDHVFTSDVDFESFKSNDFGEYGDFVLEAYTTEIQKNKVTLTRNGMLRTETDKIPLTIEKSFVFKDDSSSVDVVYTLTSAKEVEINFGIENNFNFQAGHAVDRFVLIDNSQPKNSFLDSVGSHKDVNSVALVDQYRDIAVGLYSEKKTNIWHHPIFTVSLSEGGFEKVYQGTTIVSQFNLKISQDPTVLKFKLSTGSEKGVL